jgi:phosphatidylglycerol---prolipoprotein diacylglyceryl transferase
VLYKIYDKTSARKAGRMIGLMLVWIFTSRFLIEFVKENQVPFESGLTLNMGQLLSLPFIALGLAAMFGWGERFYPIKKGP